MSETRMWISALYCTLIICIGGLLVGRESHMLTYVVYLRQLTGKYKGRRGLQLYSH